MTKTDISHQGYVKSVSNDSIIVNIVSQSACSSCHAKGSCSVSDMEDKEIEITNFNGHFVPGQQVNVRFQQSQGFTAVFWGYLFPFLLVMGTLIISNILIENELIGGLLSLGILIPYYISLYFFRHILKKMFKFEVEESN